MQDFENIHQQVSSWSPDAESLQTEVNIFVNGYAHSQVDLL